MENLGKRLHVEPHIAGAVKGKTITCYSAADIEGHLVFYFFIDYFLFCFVLFCFVLFCFVLFCFVLFFFDSK